MLEMQKLALDLQAQDKGAQAQKAAEMAARLAGVSYKGAKSAAIDMAAATREASLFNLNKGCALPKESLKLFSQYDKFENSSRTALKLL